MDALPCTRSGAAKRRGDVWRRLIETVAVSMSTNQADRMREEMHPEPDGNVRNHDLMRDTWRWRHAMLSVDELVAQAVVGQADEVVVSEPHARRLANVPLRHRAHCGIVAEKHGSGCNRGMPGAGRQRSLNDISSVTFVMIGHPPRLAGRNRHNDAAMTEAVLSSSGASVVSAFRSVIVPCSVTTPVTTMVP